MLVELVTKGNLFVLWFFIILSLCYTILFIFAVPEIFFRFRENKFINFPLVMKSFLMPPVTIIIPAHNEEKAILDTVYSILNGSYKHAYILIVNAESTDKTLELLIDTFNLQKIDTTLPKKIKTVGSMKGYYISGSHPKITVLDKSYRDKSDNLNMALNICRTPLFMTIDADTIIESDAISRIIYYLLTHSHTVTAGGAVYVLNGCRYEHGQIKEVKLPLNPIYGFQVTEYLRSFTFSRTGLNTLDGALCYAGAFTLFQYNAVLEMGGYDLNNFAQDFEIITHLHEKGHDNKYPYRIGYTPAAIAWTDVPGDLKTYWNQRYNWQYGTLLSLEKHSKMLFNPKYGVAGLITYPFYLFGETLGAVVEVFAYFLVLLSIYLGIFDLEWTIIFVLINWGFVTCLTIATLLISITTFNRYRRTRDLVWLFFLTILENVGFRQYNVICRAYATFVFTINKIRGRLKPVVELH